jgi:hypothetical protein
VGVSSTMRPSLQPYLMSKSAFIVAPDQVRIKSWAKAGGHCARRARTLNSAPPNQTSTFGCYWMLGTSWRSRALQQGRSDRYGLPEEVARCVEVPAVGPAWPGEVDRKGRRKRRERKPKQ